MLHAMFHVSLFTCRLLSIVVYVVAALILLQNYASYIRETLYVRQTVVTGYNFNYALFPRTYRIQPKVRVDGGGVTGGS